MLCWFQVLGHFETETRLLNAHAQVSVPRPPEAPEDRGPGDAHTVVGSGEGLSLGERPTVPGSLPAVSGSAVCVWTLPSSLPLGGQDHCAWGRGNPFGHTDAPGS